MTVTPLWTLSSVQAAEAVAAHTETSGAPLAERQTAHETEAAAYDAYQAAHPEVDWDAEAYAATGLEPEA